MIEINNLHFSYGREKLFKNIGLELEPNNVYGLLGLNGAGKSTLLKLMTGLLFANDGAIRALGHNPVLRKPDFLNRVFMLSEELKLPNISDREYLLIHSGFYPNFDRKRFADYLHEFEIPRGRKLSELSYGQRKKFLLSFGLACGSSLLILDEPSNGLDIPSKSQFRRLVAEALTEDRIFIISTHQVRDVESLIDPIVILHQGEVLLNQSMEDISSRIRMSHSPTRPEETSGLLYCEQVMGGFWSVWADAESPGGHIDLEILFNTVIANPALPRTLFHQHGVAA